MHICTICCIIHVHYNIVLLKEERNAPPSSSFQGVTSQITLSLMWVVPDHSFFHVSSRIILSLMWAHAQGCGVFDVWLRFDSSSRAWYSSYLCNTTLCTSSEVVVADIHFHPCTTDGAEMDVPNFYTPHFHDACMRRTDGKMIFWPLKYQTLFVLLLHRIPSSRMINIETRASILLIHLWRVVDIVWQGARPLWCEAWSMWAWLAAGPCSIWITRHILIRAPQWLRLEIHSDGRPATDQIRYQ